MFANMSRVEQEDEFMMLPVNNVLKDLSSPNELFVSLSLSFAGSGKLYDICKHTFNLLTNLHSMLTHGCSKTDLHCNVQKRFLLWRKMYVATTQMYTCSKAANVPLLQLLDPRCLLPLRSLSWMLWCVCSTMQRHHGEPCFCAVFVGVAICAPFFTQID
jgi:hypothetical protein